jgi:hypothetical protein
MNRWISRLLLIIWPGGLLAYHLAIGAHFPLPSTPGAVFISVWAVAVFLEWGLGIAEAATRRQTAWLVAQIFLPLFPTPQLYILFAPQRCNGCLGSGRRRVGCLTCDGTGKLSTGTVVTPLGPVVTQRQCATCQGRGYFDQGPCPYCRGTGRTANGCRAQGAPAPVGQAVASMIASHGLATTQGTPTLSAPSGSSPICTEYKNRRLC